MPIITAEELQEIVEFSNSVSEEYRQKCFELLLSSALKLKQSTTLPKSTIHPVTESSSVSQSLHPFIMPIDVRAFLSQYGLDEALIWKFFIKEGEDIRPIYKIKITKKATAQIQHALMLTLENAIINGQFQLELEGLRARCIDHKCYDNSNFTRNLQNNKKLFKAINNDQPLSLSPDGKSELAELLEQL